MKQSDSTSADMQIGKSFHQRENRLDNLIPHKKKMKGQLRPRKLRLHTTWKSEGDGTVRDPGPSFSLMPTAFAHRNFLQVVLETQPP